MQFYSNLKRWKFAVSEIQYNHACKQLFVIDIHYNYVYLENTRARVGIDKDVCTTESEITKLIKIKCKTYPRRLITCYLF